MNTAMYNHPATQESLNKLIQWGVTILPTDSGYLACGDVGEGKLLEPDIIYDHIVKSLTNKSAEAKETILITAGATREYIDGVRFITNVSTGNTAATIADHLSSLGYNITYLHGMNTILPQNKTDNIQFSDFNNLKNLLQDLLSNNHYDAIFHLAAISDYRVSELLKSGKPMNSEKQVKIGSGIDDLTIKLKPTSKIVDKIKSFSKNKSVVLFAFKFSGSPSLSDSKKEVAKLFKHSNADYVILNHLKDRTNKGVQSNFHFFDKSGLLQNITSSTELANVVEQIIKK